MAEGSSPGKIYAKPYFDSFKARPWCVKKVTISPWLRNRLSRKLQSCVILCPEILFWISKHGLEIEYLSKWLLSSDGEESTCNGGDPSFIPGLGRNPGFDSFRRSDRLPTSVFLGFHCGPFGKNPSAMQETWVHSLGWEDSPGEGKGYPLQYSGLENSMDCIVHGVAKSPTWLSYFHFHGDSDPQGESQIEYSTLTYRILNSQISNHL